MPIRISNSTTTTPQETGPKPSKVFHSSLNGSGKSSGRINSSVHPGAHFDHPIRFIPVAPNKTIDDRGISTVTTRTHPVHPILGPTLNQLIEHSVVASELVAANTQNKLDDYTPALYCSPITNTPDQLLDLHSSNVLINDDVFTANGYRVFCDISPEIVATTEVRSIDATNSNKSHTDYSTAVGWRMTVALVDDDTINTVVPVNPAQLDMDNTPVIEQIRTDAHGNPVLIPDELTMPMVTDVIKQRPLRFIDPNNKSFAIVQTHDIYLNDDSVILDTLKTIIEDLAGYLDPQGQQLTPVIDYDELNAWASTTFSTYAGLQAHARDWVEETPHEGLSFYACQAVESAWNLISIYEAVKDKAAANEVRVALANYLRSMEHYPVALPTYDVISKAILNTDDETFIAQMTRQNMQLTLNSHLRTLANLRDQLPHAPVPATDTVDPRLSSEQRAVVTTDSPMAIAQAGAGTGKSTTILSRMNYLIAGSCPAEQITVLSFTNAAADNITAKNSSVVSKTIARMIMEVYQNNFPTHELSTNETILDTLDIFYGDAMTTNEFMAELRKVIFNVIDKGDNPSMTALSEFVGRYTDPVIEVLNTIGQTSLELQIIICYLLADTLTEPFTPPRHIIIDEVQDNSVFEFVYTLRYAIKHHSALYLVGDSSQTLFEFRSANPKALNALESSGVFDTFKLTTNYRSNQEILDFANVALDQIEANQFAKIQLQSSILSTPSEKSFTDAVVMHTIPVGKPAEAIDELPRVIGSLRDEITNALARNENFAVLCDSRREVNACAEALEAMFPDEQIANLVSQRVYVSTTFSKYVKNYWSEVTAAPVSDAPYIFSTQVVAHLAELDRPYNLERATDIVKGQVRQWWSQNSTNVLRWIEAVNNQSMTADDFYSRLRKTILDHQIRNNAIRQSVVRTNNEARKAANADARIMVSTVHSAKGLEFDNTIVVRQPESKRSSLPQDRRRMLYVALTRAKIREHIVVFEAYGQSTLSFDYEQMIHNLRIRDANLAQEAVDSTMDAGVDFDADADQTTTAQADNPQTQDTTTAAETDTPADNNNTDETV